MGTLSLSMIIKNEEQYLENCLKSVADIVDEIVIVDTGSTDSSLTIAQKYGAKIFNFKWIDDFSAARNFALKNSTSDWILYLDADERLSKTSKKELEKIISYQEQLGVECIVKSFVQNKSVPDVMNYVRVFRNSPQISFTGKVHEQIYDSLLKNDYKIITSNIEIIHYGYNISQEKLNKKAERNLKLLLLDYKHNPSGYKAFHIGQSFFTIGKNGEAKKYFHEATKDKSLSPEQVAHSYRFLSVSEYEKANIKVAEEYLKKGLAADEEIILLHLVASKIYLELKDNAKADYHVRRAYELNQKCLTGNTGVKFDITVDELALAIHAMNIAIYSDNKELFNDFSSLEALNQLKLSQKAAIKTIGILINGKPYHNIDKISVSIKEYNPIVILRLINNYKSSEEKVILLEKFYPLFSDDVTYGLFYGNELVQAKNYDKAFEVFHRVLDSEPKNSKAILHLINLHVGLGKFKNLLPLLDKAEAIFQNDPAIIEKLESIKKKIR